MAACTLCATALFSQSLSSDEKSSIAEFIRDFESPRSCLRGYRIDTDRSNNIVLDNSSKRLTVYVNYRFAQQPFTPGLVDSIYDGIRELLPRSLRRYDIRVVFGGRTIDELIPNIYRTEGVDNTRLWGSVEYTGAPWVSNVSRPYRVDAGLAGRHIALWQSHGYYYHNDLATWRWQRPRLYCTTEDLFTQSIVVPFLMPMLENAGALVFTPRERDWQVNSVIVDNDSREGASRYIEKNGRNGEWAARESGYAPAKEVYLDRENPFSMGTSRCISTNRSSRADAEIQWLPDIPADGSYAVYVAYETFSNSIPDAAYTVMHSGGETKFKVNQTMGGGTWVYLGTFEFKKGVKERQGVLLSNNSEHSGVVSADAVRFGGGMGCVARGETPETSGLPRYVEGARYTLQLSGFPYNVYSASAEDEKSDKTDDTNSRSHAVNYLSGGSVYNPDTVGLGVPLEFSFGFHSDAGYDANDKLVGSLAIVQTLENDGELRSGPSRLMSRDAASLLLNNLQLDLSARYGFHWPVRAIYDAYLQRNGRKRQNYSEARLPLVPSMIFESLSHQNFIDMVYGHSPDFKFTLARSVYKSMLRHLCYVHNVEYAVQPLPVSNMSLSLSADNSVATLRWSPVEDPQEPTAKPSSYVVYTKIGNGGFDNGTVINRTHCTIQVQPGVIYSFKVAALNKGGESLPSEELSLYVAPEEKGRVLVVNGFHRLSAPQVVSTGTMAGFDMEADPGVPYMRTPEYCGPQLDFLRENIGNESGLGLSGSSYEGKLIAGNTFDYPYVHGEALAANGISYVSCSSEAVMNGTVNLGDYKVVDLILGVEKQGDKGSYLGYNRPYKTFPLQLQEKIASFCNNGGSLFVSGAFLASDMTKNSQDHHFIKNVLRVDYGGSVTDLSENTITGSGLCMNFRRGANEECYAVSRPDILVPVDNAFVSFVFDGSKQSAGVAYAGNYRVISTSFPFESVTDSELRSKLMGAVMRFLMR